MAIHPRICSSPITVQVMGELVGGKLTECMYNAKYTAKKSCGISYSIIPDQPAFISDIPLGYPPFVQAFCRMTSLPSFRSKSLHTAESPRLFTIKKLHW